MSIRARVLLWMRWTVCLLEIEVVLAPSTLSSRRQRLVHSFSRLDKILMGQIPMILICNDRTLQKMKPLMSTTYNMTFRRSIHIHLDWVELTLQAATGRSAISSHERLVQVGHRIHVFYSCLYVREKLKIPANVLDELVKGANSDIRQVLNMLATFKLGKRVEMDFDTGKEMSVTSRLTILLLT